ncbi:MAG TPA: hypothetical protein VGL53_25560 [Bryobacteraceae bacterium]|jgi:hypothetical protein
MTHDFEAALRIFARAGVDFILVGGLSAVARGVPVNTFDVDFVHARDTLNIGRLLPVLESIDAIFRIQPHRRLRPNESHLAGRGHINLTTTLGPIDLLCTIGDNLTYEDLLPHSDILELGEGLLVRVLKLEKLIEIKEALNTDKDRAMLPLLRRTLAEIRKSGH